MSPSLLNRVARQAANVQPIIDAATRKLAAALRQADRSDAGSCEVQTCICGAKSNDREYTLPSGDTVGSLALHLLAYHRFEVSASELAVVSAFDCGEVEPAPGDLRPGRV